MQTGSEKKFGYGISIIKESLTAPVKMVLDCWFAMFRENVEKFDAAFSAAREYMDGMEKQPGITVLQFDSLTVEPEN